MFTSVQVVFLAANNLISFLSCLLSISWFTNDLVIYKWYRESITSFWKYLIKRFWTICQKIKYFKVLFLSLCMTFNILGRYTRSSKNLLRVIEKDIILSRVALNYKFILRMTSIDSMYSSSNSKYVGIFNYIEDTVRIWTIYKRKQSIF